MRYRMIEVHTYLGERGGMQEPKPVEGGQTWGIGVIGGCFTYLTDEKGWGLTPKEANRELQEYKEGERWYPQMMKDLAETGMTTIVLDLDSVDCRIIVVDTEWKGTTP